MKKFNYEPELKESQATHRFFQEGDCFFDIETTGFSPKNSTIYLIGCAKRHNNHILVTQFFAESPSAESEVLSSFLTYIENVRSLICFNGKGFDLPFLQEKCRTYQLKNRLSDIPCLDLFRETKNLKHIFKLENYKQKTVENFLNLEREDCFHGGELIDVYRRYVSHPSEEMLKLLLLHNYEDVLGMTNLLPLLSYKDIFDGNFDVSDAKVNSYSDFQGKDGREVFFSLSFSHDLPVCVTCRHGDYLLKLNSFNGTLRAPLYSGELKYFFPNYKDYFYLPLEDTAIHKSVAAYVDAEYREKARPQNCYSKKDGLFLPQTQPVFSPAFRQEYKDKKYYFEFHDYNEESKEQLTEYCRFILNDMVQCPIRHSR